MHTILELLKGLNAYPIPMRTLLGIAECRGLSVDEEAAIGNITSRAYKLSVADIYLWLAEAPNISQGGQSYSFSEEQRKALRNKAAALYSELGESATAVQPTYGYKGSRL